MAIAPGEIITYENKIASHMSKRGVDLNHIYDEPLTIQNGLYPKEEDIRSIIGMTVEEVKTKYPQLEIRVGFPRAEPAVYIPNRLTVEVVGEKIRAILRGG